MNVIPFPEYIPILEEYLKKLSNKDESTIDSYMRILRNLQIGCLNVLDLEVNSNRVCSPEQLWKLILPEMEVNGYSISHRKPCQVGSGAILEIGSWKKKG
ncbi:hypothetical protein [Paenibacillus larvae]|uniref:hypothetical protein n=1 Tax=Paenibacillus larvae TaxID=1464 RepID=UPI002853D6FE|nr:hypothetical protein [Paenibacillus larvae]MDR5608911.1 hypothetical protein [Paenibacillus larvae]